MNKLILALCYLWIGILSGIAFLETPLKFHAEGVTREIGLSIGSLIFTVLNKVEIGFALLILFLSTLLILKTKIPKFQIFLIIIPLILVLIEGHYLYPILSERAALIYKGMEPEKAPYHIYSVAFILIKFVTLNVFGFVQLKQIK